MDGQRAGRGPDLLSGMPTAIALRLDIYPPVSSLTSCWMPFAKEREQHCLTASPQYLSSQGDPSNKSAVEAALALLLGGGRHHALVNQLATLFIEVEGPHVRPNPNPLTPAHSC